MYSTLIINFCTQLNFFRILIRRQLLCLILHHNITVYILLAVNRFENLTNMVENCKTLSIREIQNILCCYVLIFRSKVRSPSILNGKNALKKEFLINIINLKRKILKPKLLILIQLNN